MSWHHRFTRSGRMLSIPDREAMDRQRRLLLDLFAAISAHPAAHGFVRGRSVETALLPHVGCRQLLHLDIANCFPSTTRAMVEAGLAAAGIDEPLLSEVLGECLEGDSLPTGSPTSPALLNMVLWRMDALMCNLPWRYTRYADNLLVSGQNIIEREVRSIVRDQGYRLNERKCWLRVRGRQSLEVFGWVVGENIIRRPLRIRKRERAENHRQWRDE